VARLALEGGATWIQFRDKELDDRSRYETGLELRRLTRRHSALLFINDRPDIALAVGADGVHLGPDDLPVDRARAILGPRMVIGASARTEEAARRAEAAGADYLGVGPAFEARRTKPDAPPPQGPQLITDMHRYTSLPIVAIGGITPENAGVVLRAGAEAVAVISAIAEAPDISEAVAALKDAVARANSESRSKDRR
jgi:thiamine-phosphate pyrophosphorylase